MAVAPTLERTATGAVRIPMRRIQGADVLADKLFHRMRTLRDTAIEETERGLPWVDWFERPAVPRVEIEAAVRAQAVAVEGVTVRSVQAARVAGRLVVSVSVDLDTGDGSIAVATVTTADPYLTTGAPPWYAVAGLWGVTP